MKKIIILILLNLIFSLKVFAVSFKSSIVFNYKNEIEKSLIVTCAQQESLFCQSLCNQQIQCKLPEQLCQDCMTMKSQVLYSTYIDSHKIFEVDKSLIITKAMAAHFFRKSHFFTLSFDSIFNIFSPEKKVQLEAEFNSLCENNSSHTLLVGTFDNNLATLGQIVGVICQNNTQTQFLPLKLNKLYSNQKSQFWKNVSFDILTERQIYFSEQRKIADQLPLLDSKKYMEDIIKMKKNTGYMFSDPL